MKTEWDYTKLAEAYLKRPDYAQYAIDEMISTAEIKLGDSVCDVGAGAAHLTLMLATKGFKIDAVEPNDAMRFNGMKRTEQLQNVKWYEGIGEHTGMDSDKYDMVTFGSSFNVCNRQEALLESARILKSGGWFACMWNHRDLENPLQKKIENIFMTNIENYNYGTRREEQTQVINESELFKEVKYIEGTVLHTLLAEDFIKGWESHATVSRQAADKFKMIMSKIRTVVEEGKKEYIDVPYTTRIWMAQVRK